MTDLLKKISDLTAGTPAETDVVPYVDLATNTTKKALKSELKGVKGDDGTPATVDVGTTTTVATTVPASVANSGTTSAAVFDFTIPKGETGEIGPAGADGASCVWEGAWVTSTAYQLQDIVTSGGSSYVCVVAHTSGTFATDLAAGKWELACESGLDITWEGAYSAGTTYTINDAVSYNGSSYICILESTGNVPTNETYWNLMALKGTDGAGSGDVTGPASSTDNAIARFHETTGKIIQNSGATIDDSGNVVANNIASGATVSGSNTGDQTLPTRDSLGLDTDDSPQFAGIELGHATDTTIARSSAGVISVEGVVIPSISSTNTLTNKRITPRVGSTTSSATPTINTDNYDMYILTAQAEAITSFTTNLSGTPTDGQKLWISITGTAARAITWGASFEASTIALPTTTVTTARLDVGFVWNAATSKWRCVASA